MCMCMCAPKPIRDSFGSVTWSALMEVKPQTYFFGLGRSDGLVSVTFQLKPVRACFLFFVFCFFFFLARLLPHLVGVGGGFNLPDRESQSEGLFGMSGLVGVISGMEG